MNDDLDTRHCTCPRDAEGEIEVWFMERVNDRGETVRHYHRYYNPNCVRHGWKDRGPTEQAPKPGGSDA
jgi:hypothetical protein